MPKKSDWGKAGPKLKLNDQMIASIANLIRMGNYIETAVASQGIGKSSYFAWCKKAYDEKKQIKRNIYGRLVEAIDKAAADAEARGLVNIEKAVMGLPVEFLMEPVEEPIVENGVMVYGSNGRPLMRPVYGADGKPLMKVARDSRGDPIVKREGTKPDWRAEAWRLERRFCKRWGQRNSLEVNNPDGSLAQKTVIILPAKDGDGDADPQ